MSIVSTTASTLLSTYGSPHRMTSDAPLAAAFDDHLSARLLHQRIVVLGQEVDDPVANRICAQLLLLSARTRGATSASTSTPRAARSAPASRSWTRCG